MNDRKGFVAILLCGALRLGPGGARLGYGADAGEADIGRKIGADGRCKTPVGDTVNVEKATCTNGVGDALIPGWWKDPGFNPKERACTSPAWYTP